jgi:GNAT superfamily N-acetyltransferase
MNMEVLFGPHEWPAEENMKRWEMVSPEARYIFARRSSVPSEANSSASFSDPVVAFVHFRFGLEHEVPVLYIYETQLEKSVQGKGLGKFLMQLLELVARKVLLPTKLSSGVFPVTCCAHLYLWGGLIILSSTETCLPISNMTLFVCRTT